MREREREREREKEKKRESEKERERHCDDGNTLRERRRESPCVEKGDMKILQENITTKGYLVYYDTKVNNL